MRKFAIILLAALTLFAFAACSPNGNNDNGGNDDNPADTDTKIPAELQGLWITEDGEDLFEVTSETAIHHERTAI